MTRLVFALGDTPTERYGPRMRGAGVRHDPTPGEIFVRGSVEQCLSDRTGSGGENCDALLHGTGEDIVWP